MKNLKSISVITLLLISSFLIINCNKEDVNIDNKQSLTPELIGKLHNEALDNLLNNHQNLNYDTTQDGIKEQILKNNKEFLSKKITNLGIEEIEYKEIYNEPKELLSVDNLLHKNFSKVYAKSNEQFSIDNSSVFSKISYLEQNGVINLQDKITLDKVFDAYKQNFQGTLSDSDLLKKVTELKIAYSETNEDTTETNVFTTLTIINICENSLNWFSENMTEMQNKSYVRKNNKQNKVLFWHILGADAVGAVVGGVGAIIKSGIEDSTKPVDGGDMACGMLWGAATTSLGATTKILGLLGKALK